MLDFFIGLSAGVRGALDCTELADANEGLRQQFARFWLDTTPRGVRVTPELHQDSLAVVAWDSPGGERPRSADPEAWRKFYEQHPPCTARLVTYEGEAK